MKRVANSIMAALVLLTFAAVGCGPRAAYTRDTKVKCPRCGAIFTVDEGLRALQAGP